MLQVCSINFIQDTLQFCAACLLHISLRLAAFVYFTKVCGFKTRTAFDSTCFIDMYLLSCSILKTSRETEVAQKQYFLLVSDLYFLPTPSPRPFSSQAIILNISQAKILHSCQRTTYLRINFLHTGFSINPLYLLTLCLESTEAH